MGAFKKAPLCAPLQVAEEEDVDCHEHKHSTCAGAAAHACAKLASVEGASISAPTSVRSSSVPLLPPHPQLGLARGHPPPVLQLSDTCVTLDDHAVPEAI